MISPDEYLERIVAGIQSVTTTGADVTWNEELNGRQFDVVVRFRLGMLSYLVLIEVKNRTRKTSASDMDAFVQKSRDQNANKAVFVTAAGFQAGAISVAKRHAVDLFTIVFDEHGASMSPQMSFIAITRGGATESPQWNLSEPELGTNIEDIELIYADGRNFLIPNEPSQMRYYLEQTKLPDGRKLRDAIEVERLPLVSLGEHQTFDLDLSTPTEIAPPDTFAFPAGTILKFRLHFTGRMGRRIQGNILFEPTILALPVIYTDVLSGQSWQFDVRSLPLGNKRVSVGQFYLIMHPITYFYCDAIIGEQIRWYLVESFQSGQLIQAIMTQDIKYSSHYIPVRDKTIVDRLRSRLDRMKSL
ncbi:MAG: hypothetical protein EKK42_15085 [Pseudonocardiaceae bacterium]|nr:MAG: hypothetical protein EKK42_15085 [Pseudonocardiaceae bacterium]